MAGKHGGARPGAGRKRKQQPDDRGSLVVISSDNVRSERLQRMAAVLELQHRRAIGRGQLEIAARIRARLKFLKGEA